MHNHRNFTIFNVEELEKIDFTEVLETSASTVRISADGRKTFVKWEGDVPTCIQTLESKSQYYTYQEMLENLNSSDWTSNIQE